MLLFLAKPFVYVLLLVIGAALAKRRYGAQTSVGGVAGATVLRLATGVVAGLAINLSTKGQWGDRVWLELALLAPVGLGLWYAAASVGSSGAPRAARLGFAVACELVSLSMDWFIATGFSTFKMC